MSWTAIGKSLGISRHTAKVRLEALQGESLAHLVPRFGNGRPLLYLCTSFRGLWIDEIIRRVRQICPESSFSWWKNGRGRRVDLLVTTGESRVGISICGADSHTERALSPLRAAVRRGVVQAGILLHPQKTISLPFRDFLSGPEDWIRGRWFRDSSVTKRQ